MNVPIAVAQYPRTYPGLLAFSKEVRESFKGNTLLPNPTPSFAVFSADVDAFDAAQTKAGNKDPIALADRDAKALKVRQHIDSLLGYTQSVANAQSTYADAVTVILSGHFSVRKPRVYQKPDLAAKYTGLSGQAELVARAILGAGAYFWEYSLDQKTWILAAETRNAKALVTGLTPGVTTYFRFRAFTHAGRTDYSQVVSLMVH
jgi:hypothetical protein